MANEKVKPACNKVKNPCKFCLQQVSHKTGLQCQGACKKWAHFKCLNYTPGKISDIRAGIIKVTCPCPDCATTQPKEFLTNPPYTCSNNECPANTNPKCDSAECPSNKKKHHKPKCPRPPPPPPPPIYEDDQGDSCPSPETCNNEAVPCPSADYQEQRQRHHQRKSHGYEPNPRSQICRNPACKEHKPRKPAKQTCTHECASPPSESRPKKKRKPCPPKKSDSLSCFSSDLSIFDLPRPKSSPREEVCCTRPPPRPKPKDDCFPKKGKDQCPNKCNNKKMKSPLEKSPGGSCISSEISTGKTSISSASSNIRGPRHRASMMQAVQEMCNTVGKLSVQLKDLMCRMMQNS